MQEIDIDNWNRKEHFNLFRGMDLPFYNTNLNLEITGLKEYCKKKKVGLNNTLIYLTMKAINKVENFKYRVVNKKVVIYETITPVFTHINKGEELFRMIHTEYKEDLKEFDNHVKKMIDNSNCYFDFEKFNEGNNFAIISPQPWFSFTGIDHTLSFNKDDAIPKISWGKYFTEGSRVKLPFNVQVNHIFIDGFHIGQLVNLLQEEVFTLVN